MTVFSPTDPVSDSGRFECPHCSDRFESVGDKKRHIRTSHPKEK